MEGRRTTSILPRNSSGRPISTIRPSWNRFSEKHFPECFREYAELLHWDQYWHTTLDTSDPPFWKWFVGGKLNACYNCVDRHLEKHKNKAALIFVPEPEQESATVITYQELYRRVNEVAAMLRDFAELKTGDRVTIHMPMIPELPITMLACARLGVVHSVVFGGFSGEACGLRAADSGSRVLIYADGYFRNGKWVDHKGSADIAVQTAEKEGQHIDKVLVWRRYRGKYNSESPMIMKRDYFVDEVLKDYRGSHRRTGFHGRRSAAVPDVHQRHHRQTERLPASHRRLSRVRHRHFQVLPGHSSQRRVLVHGRHWLDHRPLLHRVRPDGAGAPPASCTKACRNFPMPAARGASPNAWTSTFFTLRRPRFACCAKPAATSRKKYNYHFKHMTTVGEPIEPEVWKWYHRVVGKGEAVIVDTWWQTETGGFLITTKPALDAMKPGSAGPAALGIYPVIWDENGKEVTAGSGNAGNICIRNPWPGIMQTIWGDPQRFVNQYYKKYNKDPHSKDWRDWPYYAADGAVLPADGYYRILGRVDDVINVAGHRLGTKELESACLTISEIAEAAVVPVVDEVKGRVPEVYVSLKPGVSPSKAVQDKIISTIETMIGKIARPKKIHIVPDMPKTRSGKIMRRVLAAISNNLDTGDITTLANPDIVAQIREQVQGRGVGPLKDGPRTSSCLARKISANRTRRH